MVREMTSQIQADRILKFGSHDSVRSERWVVACIGLLLGFCNLGLLHDLEMLYSSGDVNVESGVGIESREDFEANVASAPIGRKLGFAGLVVVGIYCILTIPKGGSMGSFSVLIPSLLFFAWISASANWSVERTQTLREIFRIVVYVFVVSSVVRRFQGRDVVKIMIASTLVSVGAVYISEIAIGIFRPWASDFRMHGTMHASSFAHQCLVLAIAAAALSVDSPRKFFWQLLLVFAAVSMVFSKTRGGLFAALGGLAYIQILRYNSRTNLLIGTSLATAIASVIFLSEIFGPKLWQQIGSAVSLGRSEGVSTLTGRLPLWEVIWRDCADTRLFGAGYGAFFTTKRTISLAGTLQWFPSHSHNAYLETIVDLGYIGLAILIWLITASFVVATKLSVQTKKYAYLFVAGLVAAGVIDGFVEVIFVSIRELGLYVGLAIMMLIFRHPTDIIHDLEPRSKLKQYALKRVHPSNLQSTS